jgi:K+-dependent Na+/Ca+ exchanger-like protein
MNIPALLFDIVVLVLSFGAIHYVSEKYFISTLDYLSKKLRLSSDMAGSTLMAAGSSAPELAVALIAVFMKGGHEAIGVGTIVGSALFNILIITGIVMYIKRSSKLVWQPIFRDIIFYVLSILLLAYIFSQGEVDLFAGVLLVGTYILYIAVVYYWKRIFPYEDREVELEEPEEKPAKKYAMLALFMQKINKSLLRYQFLTFILSIGLISLFSWILVSSAVDISELLGVPELLVGLTVVAIGTSIPDLLSSRIVAKQGRPGMAINNAIGSNIFDILIGLGLPFLLFALIFNTGFVVESSDLVYSIGILLASAVLLFLFFFLGKWKTSRMVGIIMIVLYCLYLGQVIYNNVY